MRAITGSPPRVRGKGKGGKEKVCILRITPARAGKSPLPARGNSCLGDHPRACGEKVREQLRKLNAQGSPPRVRGKDTGAAAEAQRTGITPAHAGKSFGAFNHRLNIQDHPRTRGEKLRLQTPTPGVKGSPPHTRGKVVVLGHPFVVLGITPAHAGKSTYKAGHTGLSWDHPRTRGEKFILPEHELPRKGSPPHTRGKDNL